MGNKCRFFVNVESFHKEVSGSKTLNTIVFPDGTKKKILIDCGLNQEEKYDDSNNSLPFNAEEIDYVVVTHTHIDHTGLLPLLVKDGYHGEIITTQDTFLLMPAMLRDSCRIQNGKSKFMLKLFKKNKPKLNTKFEFKAKSKDIPKTHFKFKAKAKIDAKSCVPTFDEDDVEETLALVRTCPFEKTIKLDDNIKLTFFPNAHLPGAAMVLLQTSYHNHDDSRRYGNINLLFTGDYNNKSAFLDSKPLPKWVYSLPLNIVQESTYGDTYSSEIEYPFEENILKAISEGKEILIPALALGRYQEILFCLKKWQDEGKLSKNIPIYCDGNLGIYFTKMFLSGSLQLKDESKDFLPENVQYITNRVKRDEVLSMKGCKIIVTTSGMGSHGPAEAYIPIFLKRKDSLIHFTCYLAENTMGRKLLDTTKDEYVEIKGMKIKKQAEIKFTFEFSAHAKKDELIEFLKEFDDIKTVLINHGSIESKDAYSTTVLKEVNTKDVCILGSGYYFRLNGYGLVRSSSTHSNFS